MKHLLLLLTSLTLAASVNVSAANPASDKSPSGNAFSVSGYAQSHRLIASRSDNLARSPDLPYVAD